MNKRAEELARQGYSNGEIFAMLELTPPHVSDLQRSDPTLFFSMATGRAAYVQELLDKLSRLASGWDDQVDGPKPSIAAISSLLARADLQQAALCNAYDMLLMGGFTNDRPALKHSSAEVTKLLRVK